ncbi:hypothetical protein HG433_001160 [Candidatus Saccharibacteria bacterium]|jgi:hypothetical protein|nr:hypothetical protein [Candidatus Saccharibacteria bacterium]
MKHYGRIVMAALAMYALVCAVLLLVGGAQMLSASQGEGLLLGLALVLPYVLGGLWYWRYGRRHGASFVGVTTGLLVIICTGLGSYVAGFLVSFAVHGVEAQASDVTRLTWPAQPIMTFAELPAVSNLLPYVPIVILLAYCGIAARDGMRYIQKHHIKMLVSQDDLQAKKVESVEGRI